MLFPHTVSLESKYTIDKDKSRPRQLLPQKYIEAELNQTEKIR